MSPRPHDFNPEEEQEIYEIFSTLRREVYDAIKDLATQIFARIDLQQGEDERAAQPDLIKVIEHSLIHLLQVIMELFQGTSPPQLPPGEDAVENTAQARPPIIRRHNTPRASTEEE